RSGSCGLVRAQPPRSALESGPRRARLHPQQRAGGAGALPFERGGGRSDIRSLRASQGTRLMPDAVELGQPAVEGGRFDGAFLFCAGCGVVHRVTATDRAPIYLPDGTSVAADDLQEFLAA